MADVITVPASYLLLYAIVLINSILVLWGGDAEQRGQSLPHVVAHLNKDATEKLLEDFHEENKCSKSENQLRALPETVDVATLHM